MASLKKYVRYIVIIFATSIFWVALYLIFHINFSIDINNTQLSGILEPISYIADIVICVCAVLALGQIFLMRSQLKYQTGTETFKHCIFFTDEIIPKYKILKNLMIDNNVAIYSGGDSLEDARNYCNSMSADDQKIIDDSLTDLGNALESFSLAINNKIVDEEVVYFYAVKSFIEMMSIVLPYVLIHDSSDIHEYSSLTLYRKWKAKYFIEQHQLNTKESKNYIKIKATGRVIKK